MFKLNEMPLPTNFHLKLTVSILTTVVMILSTSPAFTMQPISDDEFLARDFSAETERKGEEIRYISEMRPLGSPLTASTEEISEIEKMAAVPNSGKSSRFPEFLDTLQEFDKSIPLKVRTYGVKGRVLGMISGGFLGLYYGGWSAFAGIVGGGLLGAGVGENYDQDPSSTTLSEQYRILAPNEKEMVLDFFDREIVKLVLLDVGVGETKTYGQYSSSTINERKNVPYSASPQSLSPTPNFMTSIQLYNFSGPSGVKVYRRSMLNAIRLAGDIEKNNGIDASMFRQRINEGLGGDFWKNVTQTFTYNTGKRKEKKHKPVVVAMCSNRDKQILVAFYGTTGNLIGRDWLTNFKVLSKSIPYGGQAHMGFVDAAESCKDKMVRKIKSLVPEGQNLSDFQVILVGHSLGGAVSALSGLHMLEALATTENKKLNSETNSKNNVTILTMGQPYVWRAGNFTPVSGGFTQAQEYERLIKQFNLLRLVSSKTGEKSDDVVTNNLLGALDYGHIGYLRHVKMDPKIAKQKADTFHYLSTYDYAVMKDPNI